MDDLKVEVLFENGAYYEVSLTDQGAAVAVPSAVAPVCDFIRLWSLTPPVFPVESAACDRVSYGRNTPVTSTDSFGTSLFVHFSKSEGSTLCLRLFRYFLIFENFCRPLTPSHYNHFTTYPCDLFGRSPINYVSPACRKM